MSEQVIENAVKIATFGGLTGTVIGGLALAEWLAIGGFIITVLGFAVNLWHKRALFNLEKERLKFEMRQGKT